MIVAHNLLAMNAKRMLGVNSQSTAKSAEKLSSGYKINRAADDSAGLAISEKMRRQIRGLRQGANNTTDGISWVKIGDGAMNEVSDMLNRMMELSVKAANGTMSDNDRVAIDLEVKQIKKEINRVAVTTEFNEIPIFDNINYQLSLVDLVGPENITISGHFDERLTVTDGMKWTTGTPPQVGETYAAAIIDFSEVENLDDLLSKGFNSTCMTCNNHYSVVFESGLGGDYNKTQDTNSNHTLEVDLDYLKREVASGKTIAEALVKVMSGGVFDFHYTQYAVGDPNGTPRNNNTLYIYDSRPKHIGDLSAIFEEKPFNRDNQWYAEREIRIQHSGESNDFTEIPCFALNTKALGLSEASVRTVEQALETLDSLSDACNYVSSKRALYGAFQNRLEHTYDNLQNIAENTTAAESRIRDTDMADEMVLYSNYNILLQAGQAMLAQANQSNQGVISLLS